MNKTTLNSQKEKHFMLSLRRATYADNLHHNTLLKFLSTLSLRRATDLFAISARARLISIHALLAESDHLPASFHPMSLDFYPRSPCGERRGDRLSCFGRIIFLSTLSLRRATTLPRRFIRGSNNFYPRSPCGERRRPDKLQLPQNHFYPRSPCGERPALSLPFGAVWIISIHALLAESDRPNHGKRNKKVKFLSTLSLRRATKAHPQSHFQLLFLSTLSLRRATT